MKRQVGRHLNVEYYVEILRLPGKSLFSPAQIAHRKFDKKHDSESFRRMFNAVYRFAERNGLKDKPDNCARHANGTPVVVNGTYQLLPGERRPKWYGETWRQHFYDDDLLHFRNQYREKVVNALGNILAAKQKKPADVITLPSPNPKKRMSMKWWLIAMVAIVFTATSLYNYNYLSQGFHVLQRQGPKAVMAFFQNRGETFDNLFGQAWAAFRNGEYKKAEELGHRVLESRTNKNQARAFYLLGSLKSQQGKYDEAHEYLLSAEATFETMNYGHGVYRTRLVLSKMYLDVKDMDNARYYANLAGANPKAQSDEYFYYIQSQIAFLFSDFEAALDFALHREKVFNGDRSQLPSIYSEIGFYYGLLGYQDQCLEYTVRAGGVANELKNNSAMMYNNINMCLYLKCAMKDYTDLRHSILVYARANKEAKLMEWMYFVDKFTCPLKRAGDGHPLPAIDPDDPPPETPANRAGNGQVTRDVGSGDPPPPDDPNDPPPESPENREGNAPLQSDRGNDL